MRGKRNTSLSIITLLVSLSQRHVFPTRNTGRWGLYPGYPAPAYVPAPSVAAPNYDSSGYGLNTPYVHDGYGLYTAANPGYVGPVVLGRRRRK